MNLGNIKNKYVLSFLKVLLVSAAVHFLILVVIAIKEQSLLVLNYFAILNMDYFFPVLGSFSAGLVSFLVVMALYVGILFLWQENP